MARTPGRVRVVAPRWLPLGGRALGWPDRDRLCAHVRGDAFRGDEPRLRLRDQRRLLRGRRLELRDAAAELRLPADPAARRRRTHAELQTEAPAGVAGTAALGQPARVGTAGRRRLPALLRAS